MKDVMNAAYICQKVKHGHERFPHCPDCYYEDKEKIRQLKKEIKKLREENKRR